MLNNAIQPGEAAFILGPSYVRSIQYRTNNNIGAEMDPIVTLPVDPRTIALIFGSSFGDGIHNNYKNNILNELSPILTDAINRKATAYIFGSSYGAGIHDIHMNQGSPLGYDNVVYEDGAILLKLDDEHWGEIFLAFASQRFPTGSCGESEPDSSSLEDLLGQ